VRTHTFSLTACCVALVAGCARPATTPSGDGDPTPPAGPGRYSHSAIQRTIAPWDGPATQLVLAEKPLDEGKPPKSVGPAVSVRIYQAPADLSKKRVRLEGIERRRGEAVWVEEGGKATPLAWAQIDFEEVREGKPVAGTYEVAFADGKRERGRFEAQWWPAEGPGG
jgi:hypothetical protein